MWQPATLGDALREFLEFDAQYETYLRSSLHEPYKLATKDARADMLKMGKGVQFLYENLSSLNKKTALVGAKIAYSLTYQLRKPTFVANGRGEMMMNDFLAKASAT